VIIIPDDPMAGLSPAVRAAIQSHQTPVIKDGIAVIYPYAPNQQWTVYCAPLHPTDIKVGPDEALNEDSAMIGDKTRWEAQVLPPNTIRVQPLGTSADPAMSTDLIIDSNKRSYRLLLKLRPRYTETISWYFPDDVRAAQAARQEAIAKAAKEQQQ